MGLRKDMRLKQAIEALTRAGKSQKEIAVELGLSRGTVYRVQKLSGLHARSTIPTAATERKILRLLRKGIRRKRVEELTRSTVHAVRRIAEAHGISSRVDPLSPEQHEKLREEVRRHADYAWNLAAKYNISYKRALRIAHLELGVPLFVGAATWPPLRSPFPEKPAAVAIEKTKPDNEALRRCVEVVLRIFPEWCFTMERAAEVDAVIVSTIVNTLLHYAPHLSPKSVAHYSGDLHQAISCVRADNAQRAN